MTEHLRALIVILFLAIIGFTFAKKLLSADITKEEFARWQKLWFGTTLLAFLSHDFWIYITIAFFLVIALSKSSPHKLAIYWILLTVIPALSASIPGFGLVNFLFVINQPRFISLIILIPASLAAARGNTFKFGKAGTDKFVLLYLIVLAGVKFRDAESFTEALRQVLYLYLDFFLPYYVASRSVKSLQQMNAAMYALIITAMTIALIALFESQKGWMLYNSIAYALDLKLSFGNYMGRGGSWRAIASLSHPIVLGYFMVIALGFYLYYSQLVQRKIFRRLGMLLIALGVYLPLSRGPWMGALAVLVFFLAQGPAPIKKLSTLFATGIFGLLILSMLPAGQKIINLLPYMSNVNQDNVNYREQLFTNGMIVVNRYPLFGSKNYLDNPEMRALIQGEGIIDIVNSYLGVALESGYIGAGLFIGAFVSTLLAVRRQTKRLKDKQLPLYTLGRALSSTIVGIMVVIATTSSISVVSMLYWSVLGLAIAYTRLAQQPENQATTKL